mmetsp:Transcript_44398/g.115485  ORF Transcript_44398/g.115485 Transcript_44398/m.115485 type:complete len:288 (-) Transcript_44398:245-1108(-)
MSLAHRSQLPGLIPALCGALTTVGSRACPRGQLRLLGVFGVYGVAGELRGEPGGEPSASGGSPAGSGGLAAGGSGAAFTTKPVTFPSGTRVVWRSLPVCRLHRQRAASLEPLSSESSASHASMHITAPPWTSRLWSSSPVPSCHFRMPPSAAPLNSQPDASSARSEVTAAPCAFRPAGSKRWCASPSSRPRLCMEPSSQPTSRHPAGSQASMQDAQPGSCSAGFHSAAPVDASHLPTVLSLEPLKTPAPPPSQRHRTEREWPLGQRPPACTRSLPSSRLQASTAPSL